MSDHAEVATASRELRHGEHVDTIESVDLVFREQRKLSFTYGALFFGVTLLLPVMTNWVESWWSNTIWGGFTLNYLVISLLYYVFLWAMAWTYAQRADRLDDKLAHMAEALLKKQAG